MRNIKLEIEYDGTNYCGWQIQSCTSYIVYRISIQETLEKILSKILQEKIKVIGSGRTDAGVHALAQVANFKTDSSIALEKLQNGLNALLPEDISINKVEERSLDFHSRFSAKSKVYRYTILNLPSRSAILRNVVYFYPYSLDINLMRKQARYLLGKHDFRSFCASKSGVKDTIRTIKKISIRKICYPLSLPCRQAGAIRYPLLVIDIEANGFLYNMVRNIVGTLIEIGRGKISQGSIKKILYSRDRTLAGPTAPARGLCLVEVKY